jgi:RsiW-degrading membrane proteinase PrsW (M82 family)
VGFLRVLLLSSAPSLFFLWLFWKKDRFEREPLKYVFSLFGLGALVAVPVYAVQVLLPPLDGTLYEFVVRVAAVEEVFKILPVVMFARRRIFSEPMDGIVYAVAAALGFATVENALYALRFGDAIIAQRAFTSTLAHLGFSGLVGFYLGKAKAGHAPQRHVVWALATAILMHSSYNLLLRFGAGPDAPPIVARATIIVIVSTMMALLTYAVRKAEQLSPYRP